MRLSLYKEIPRFANRPPTMQCAFYAGEYWRITLVKVSKGNFYDCLLETSILKEILMQSQYHRTWEYSSVARILTFHMNDRLSITENRSNYYILIR
jgi:hypothetical protein